MKITKRELKKAIKEEIEKATLNETSLSRVKDKAENQMIPFIMNLYQVFNESLKVLNTS